MFCVQYLEYWNKAHLIACQCACVADDAAAIHIISIYDIPMRGRNLSHTIYQRISTLQTSCVRAKGADVGCRQAERGEAVLVQYLYITYTWWANIPRMEESLNKLKILNYFHT